MRIAILLLLGAALALADQFQAPVFDHPDGNAPAAVDFYMDATASLQGFVRADRETTFAYFVKTLEERLHSQFPPSQVQIALHRFGLVSQPFSDIRESWTPAFYAPAKGYEDTDLTVVAREMKAGHFVVILTDLFQSDSHIESFRAQLVKNGLGRQFQFAVLAFRAEFAGEIYDIPPGKSKALYHGLRPAYALLLGPAPQLRTLLDGMQARAGDLGTPINASLISSSVGTPVTNFHDLKWGNSEASPFYAMGFDPEDGLIQGGPRPFARELRISRSARQAQITFNAVVQLRPYEAAPAVDSLALTHSVRMCSTQSPGMLDRLWSSKDAKSGAAKDVCPLAEPAFDLVYDDSSVNASKAGTDRVNLAVKLDLGKREDAVKPIKARSERLYVVQTGVVASQATMPLPAWVAGFNEDGRSRFDGARTPDLKDFLQSMQESVYSAGPPTLLKDDLYIDSK